MSRDEFKKLLRRNSDATLLGPCLRDDLVPHAFDLNPPGWNECRDYLAHEVGAIPEQVTVVGSARFGFSLKPWNNLKSFHDRSDIDVVVVNADIFDSIWHALLAAAYPRPPATNWVGGWLAARKSELYTGWVTPLEIKLDAKIFGVRAKPILQFNATWFNALKRASSFSSRRHEDVNGRLYRTWQHAELYHMHSLSALRKSLDL